MMAIRWLLLLSLITQMGEFDPCQAQNQKGDLVLSDCLVRAKRDVLIPAQEAGVLTELKVQEGSQLKKGDLLAITDEGQAKAAHEVAKVRLAAAEKRAEEDIEEKFAIISAAVAKNDWEQDLAANRQHAKSVPDIEVQQKKLSYDRAKLQIKKAQHDGLLALLEVDISVAELAAAQLGIQRRTIDAPFDGEVVKIIRQQSEWLNPGDPILRLVEFDALYVENFILSSEHNPGEILGQPVTVQVDLARGQKMSVSGKIVYVSQMVQSDGSYLVRAEVRNERKNNQWLLRPGVLARMTIRLSSESQ